MDGLVPDEVKKRLYDAAVDAAARASKRRWPRLAKFLDWIRADESLRRFGEALDRAGQNFFRLVRERNAALGDELESATSIWNSPELVESLQSILSSPGADRLPEWASLRAIFSAHAPTLAQNPPLLDEVLRLLVNLLVREVSLLPEFREQYRFELERRAAESTIRLNQHFADFGTLLRGGQAVPPFTSLPASSTDADLLDANAQRSMLPPLNSHSAAIWALSVEARIPPSIVVIGPDTRRVALLPTDATPDYGYLEFFGDKDTLLEASVFLARQYPNSMISRYPASWLPATQRTSPLVLIGGPDDDEGIGGNRIARQVMEHYEIPISYHDDCEGIDYCGTDFRTVYAPDGRLLVDWGLIMRLPNPWNKNARVLLIQGVHTHGVLGAFRAITDPAVAAESNSVVHNTLGEDAIFSALVKVKRLDGVTTTTSISSDHLRSHGH